MRLSSRRSGRLLAGVAAAVGLLVVAPGASGADSYGFDAPISGALAGAHLFVANNGNNSVTEVNATTGAFIGTVSGSSFDLRAPTAVRVIGPDAFVTNGSGNSVTEFMTGNRHLVRVISGSTYGFSDPIAMTSANGDLFVLSAAGAVTEVNDTTGAFVGIATGSPYGFDGADSIVAAGGRLFVANGSSNSLTILSDTTLAFISLLNASKYQFSDPSGVTALMGHVWVSNQTGGSLTEITGSTGGLMKVIVNGNLPTPGPITHGDNYVFTASPPGGSPMITQVETNGTVEWMMCNTNGPYLFNNPQSLVVYKTTLWVVNEGGNSLTEMDAGSGALIAVIS